MTYALIQNGAVAQYPYSFAALRKDNPDVSFPADPTDERLAEFGVIKVAPSAQPSYDLTKNIVEGTPALVGGVWTQTWGEVAASPEDIASRQTLADDETRRLAVKADAFVTSFTTMTPAEVSTYITNNGTTVAALRTIVIKLAQMVLILARREFRR